MIYLLHLTFFRNYVKLLKKKKITINNAGFSMKLGFQPSKTDCFSRKLMVDSMFLRNENTGLSCKSLQPIQGLQHILREKLRNVYVYIYINK